MSETIRKMTFEDAAIVAVIDNIVSEDPWSAKLFHDCVLVGYHCFVLENNEDNTIMGFCLLNNSLDEAHVLNVAVRPDCQGRGYGLKLMNHLIATAKNINAKKIYLEVRVSNKIAQNMYKKLNFHKIGERKDYYPVKSTGKREDAIILSLDI